MVEKKLGCFCGVHGFGARGKNYPLTKAMVDHDCNRIKTSDQRKVGDEVDGEVLERAGTLEGKESDGWNCRMDEDLVCLANHTARNVFSDVDKEAGPPVVF